MQFLTITQAAKETGLPPGTLRAMRNKKLLPGFYAGSRFYINLDMLREQLEAECVANAGKAGEMDRAQ